MAIGNMIRYAMMTKPQKQNLPTCLSGQDMLAKAKAITSKTLLFLTSAIKAKGDIPMAQ